MGVSKSRMLSPKSRLQNNIFLNSLGVEIGRFQLKQSSYVGLLQHYSSRARWFGTLCIIYQNYSFNTVF